MYRAELLRDNIEINVITAGQVTFTIFDEFDFTHKNNNATIETQNNRAMVEYLLDKD